MGKSVPSIRTILPAAVSALFLFLPIFAMAYLQHPRNVGFDFQIVPVWVEAFAGAAVFSLPVGIMIGLFTSYAEGKQDRIQKMLDRK